MADKQPPRTKKYYRSTKSGAGMTSAGVKKTRGYTIQNIFVDMEKESQRKIL